MTQRSARGWLTVALTTAALAIYANALPNPFLSDDGPIIARSPTMVTPSRAGLAKIWTTSYWQVITPTGHTTWLSEGGRNLYRPITIFTFWLNAWITGLEPWAFRLVNILLHVAAAAMVGRWCREWCGRSGAALATFVVLLHPIATDVINRIVGRADILVLLGVAGFLAVQRSAQRSAWTWRRVGGAAFWTWVALGAKESGTIVVPLAAVQAWLGRDQRAANRERHAWRAAVAFGVPVLAYAVGRSSAVQAPHYGRALWDLTGNPLAGAPLSARIPGALSLATRYLRLLVWPYPLLSFNLASRSSTWSDPSVWIGGTLLACITVCAVSMARKQALLTLAAAWWGASFLIVSQLVVPIGTYMELRLAYPMIGALAAACAAVAELRVWTISRPARLAACTGLVVAAGVAVALIVTRNVESASDISLAEADVRHRPNDAGELIELAGTYEGAGRSSDAEKLFVKATELASSSSQAWYELGAFNAAHGRPEVAKQMYERSLTANPTQTVVLSVLAQMALDRGDLATAERLLTTAQRGDPDDPYVAYDLAVLDDARGNRDSAVQRLRQLIARRPDFAKAVDGLAMIEAERAGSQVR